MKFNGLSFKRFDIEEADHWHCRLLRMHCEWPRRREA
jgi:hypothetical protein